MLNFGDTAIAPGRSVKAIVGTQLKTTMFIKILELLLLRKMPLINSPVEIAIKQKYQPQITEKSLRCD